MHVVSRRGKWRGTRSCHSPASVAGNCVISRRENLGHVMDRVVRWRVKSELGASGQTALLRVVSCKIVSSIVC